MVALNLSLPEREIGVVYRLSCFLVVMNLFYLLFDNVDTVFSPIEAPGAKEMVWGASIFRPEAPNFQINMVKKDSKNSCVFQPQNTHVQHQYNKKILGKKPFKGL